MQSSPSLVMCTPVLVSTSNKSMWIYVQLITLLHMLKVVDSSMLVDSGADIFCINWQFVRKHWLPIKKLAFSITVCNVDQTANKTGTIHYTCTLYTNMKEIAQKHLFYIMGCCHIHKITLSATPDLHSHVHQLWSTLAQVAVRTLQTSVYILLHSVPYTFDPSVLDSLLGFHCSCVQLWTQLRLYFSSVSAFVRIWVQSKLRLHI